MEDPTSPSPPESTRTDVFVQTLQRQRSQVDAFLAAHRKRLLTAEANLAAQIDRISRELVEARSRSSHAEGELTSRADDLEQKTRDIARLNEQFEAAQTTWQAAQDQASRQQQQLADQLKHHVSSVCRAINDPSDKEISILWEAANDLEQVMKFKG